MSSNHIFARALRLAKQDAAAEALFASKAGRRLAQPKVDPLVFVSVGTESAGLPGNGRKAGPVLQGIQRVTVGQSLNVIFKLPGFDGWIKATAKVVWLGGSANAAGLKFVDIPGESRRVVDNWLSMRAEASRQSVATGSPAEAKNIALPPSREFQLDSYQIALPVEAIEVIPGPQAFRPVLMQAVAQSSSRNSVAVVQPNVEKSVPSVKKVEKSIFSVEKSVAAPHFFETATSSPAPVQPAVSQEVSHRQRTGTQPFALALAALIGMFVVAGVIFWHSQGELSPRPASAQRAQPAVPVEAAALPDAPIEANQSFSAAPRAESVVASDVASVVPSTTAMQSAAKAEKLQKLAAPVATNRSLSAAVRPVVNRPAPGQQIARKTPPSAPILPAANSGSAAVISTPTPAVAAPASSISERPSPSEPAVPSATAGKESLPAVVLASNSETATGSVEVISDPYPSIRAPADGASRASRPVALTIGHLVSKIEPVYPPDALRQRISGTVKLHVVRGLDGRVESASVTDGPAPLRDAALHAVQQWRYEPTLLGSAPVGAEEDVAVVFRITTPSHPAN